MACTSANVYASIKRCPGEIITPGTRESVWFIPAADITAWPTASPSTGKLTGSFTLATGKKWFTLKGMSKQGNAEAAPVGEKPCKSFDVTLNVFIPGLAAENVGWANMASNDDLVFAYQEKDGTIKIVGYEFGDVDVAPTSNTGQASGDTVGQTCAITCNMPYQPLAVTGISSLGAIDGVEASDDEGE